MLNKKANRKSDEFRKIHDDIYRAYNANKLSLADIQVLIAVLQKLQMNPDTIFYVPFPEIFERDSDGEMVHYVIPN